MNIVLRRSFDNLCSFLAKRCLDKNYCSVLCLHRVAKRDESRLDANDHLKVSPNFLCLLIRSFKSAGYSFLSLDELAHNINRKIKCKKTVALTFDDGYRDTFINGYPVLADEKVPATVYVATGLSNGDGIAWWDVIEDFLLANDDIVLPSGNPMCIKTRQQKENAFLLLRKWAFSLPINKLKQTVLSYCNDAQEEKYLSQMADKRILSEFSNKGLITLGCHTHRHIPCGLLSSMEVKNDIQESLLNLNAKGIHANHFAFPYGADEHNPERFKQFFRECGFLTCATTFCDVASTRKCDPYFIPRIAVFERDGYDAGCHIQQVRTMAFKSKLRKII